jgi:hypothetical protein
LGLVGGRRLHRRAGRHGGSAPASEHGPAAIADGRRHRHQRLEAFCAHSELLAAGARVRKGDTLQLGYVAAGRRFGVIASIDARGTVTLHLPETPGPAAALERDGERALAHAFELDDSPGFERFVFVAADSLFTTADVTSALAAGHAFPTSLSTVEITLKKETP